MQRKDGGAVTEKSTINVVVIDYQGCAFAPANTNDKYFLSSSLISFMKGKYDYFVGHTMRCLVNNDKIKMQCKNHVPASEYAKFDENYRIDSITKHIAEDTRTENLAVVTLDDLVGGVVGAGYAALMRYESQHEVPDMAYVSKDNQYELMQKNNELLLLTARYLADEMPDKTIQMDVIDDSLGNCKKALNADQQAGWPASVILNRVYRFNANMKHPQVDEIAKEDLQSSQKKPSERVNVQPVRQVKHVSFFQPAPETLSDNAADDVVLRRSARIAAAPKPHYAATRL